MMQCPIHDIHRAFTFAKEAAMPERTLRVIRELLDASRDLIAQAERIRQEAQQVAEDCRRQRLAEPRRPDDPHDDPSPASKSTT
jgi:hypothetical protein